MKKFTHLDEDLIKENSKIEKKFQIAIESSFSKIETIINELEKKRSEQLKKSSDWEYVSDINYVNEKLDDILDFFGLKDINDTNKFNI